MYLGWLGMQCTRYLCDSVAVYTTAVPSCRIKMFGLKRSSISCVVSINLRLLLSIFTQLKKYICSQGRQRRVSISAQISGFLQFVVQRYTCASLSIQLPYNEYIQLNLTFDHISKVLHFSKYMFVTACDCVLKMCKIKSEIKVISA